jgi:leishmanolysin
MADGCGIYGPYANCMDSASTDNGYASYTFEVDNTNSFCVSSTLGTVSLPNTLTSRCYPYVCNPTNIIFTIGSYSITCLSTDPAGTQKTLSSMTGTLTCPDFASFCQHTRITCPNWCSQNGYCMAGVCNCLPGYYGSDCSQTQCTSGTYYNPTNSTCVTVCPNKYYQNKYSQSCAPCSSACQQCYS